MKLLASILLIIPFSVCAATSAELSGKWIHTKYQSMRVEISDNGSSFVITELKDEISKKHVAKLAGGILVVNTGPCGINVDIEKKSGNLLFGGQEYRRLKAGESFDYARKNPSRF
jgi:hypothetical protein